MSAKEKTPFERALAELAPKPRLFVLAYLCEPNATKAAKAAGYSERTAAVIGHENLRKPKIAAAIEAGFEQVMGANEVLARTAEVAASTMEDFLSIETVEYTESTFMDADEALDLITDSIANLSEELDSAKPERAEWIITELRRLHRLEKKCEREFEAAQQLADAEGDTAPKRRRAHQVFIDLEWKSRVVVRLDLQKARELGKLHLIKKLKETKYGVEIELHDAAAARELLGKHYRLWSDRVALENPDGSPIKFIVGVPEGTV